MILFDADPGAWGEMAEMLVTFTTDPHIGDTFWLDVGEERDGDEYLTTTDGAHLLDHDGSWDDILTQVRAARDYALTTAAAGAATVLVINSVSQLAAITRAGAAAQALCSDSASERLSADPEVDIQPQKGHWRQANARWQSLMWLLMEFPGIVLVTSRADSFPAEDTKATNTMFRRPDLPMELMYQVTACVQLRCGAAPVLTIANNRHARGGLLTELPDLTIADLIYDQLRFDPAAIAARVLRTSVEAMVVQLFTASALEQLEIMRGECVDRLGGDHPKLTTAYEKHRRHLRLIEMAHQMLEITSISELDDRHNAIAGEVGRDQPIVNRAYETRRRQLLEQAEMAAKWVCDTTDLDELKSRYLRATEKSGRCPVIDQATIQRKAELEQAQSATSSTQYGHDSGDTAPTENPTESAGDESRELTVTSSAA
ncbi:hypothetical protein AB0C34_18010 [Nocardia sp. NPDC049220]|uniref:hypothetical protein n=1 Tax=Nocardia sp. NPDC049220 TaxID=3155273 RepID=UPI0033CF2E35